MRFGVGDAMGVNWGNTKRLLGSSVAIFSGFGKALPLVPGKALLYSYYP